MQAKQSLIDQAQAQLRDATTAITTEKRALAQLEDQRLARQMLELRVTNLRNTNDVNRTHLATTGPPARHDVSLGDADTGLTFDVSDMPDSVEELTPEQERYLDSLPSSTVLEARVRAYTTHNNTLDEKRKTLQGKSFALEKKLRRLIALSTGTEETQVDAMLGPLRDAVESEGGEDVDYLRLREFLRKIA
jgi:regulatory protein SWI6